MKFIKSILKFSMSKIDFSNIILSFYP